MDDRPVGAASPPPNRVRRPHTGGPRRSSASPARRARHEDAPPSPDRARYPDPRQARPQEVARAPARGRGEHPPHRSPARHRADRGHSPPRRAERHRHADAELEDIDLDVRNMPNLPSDWVAPKGGPVVPLAKPPPPPVMGPPAEAYDHYRGSPERPKRQERHQHVYANGHANGARAEILGDRPAGLNKQRSVVSDYYQVQLQEDDKHGLELPVIRSNDLEGGHAGRDIPDKCQKDVKRDRRSFFAFAFYLCALIFYFYTRISRTLDGLSSGQKVYGIFVLIVELLGATTVMSCGVNHLWKVKQKPLGPCKRPYDIHILIACYKEPADIVENTVKHAFEFTLPVGCRSKSIWVCDDEPQDSENRRAKDAACRKYGATHIFDRPRQKGGEMNPKSNNLNNCMMNYIWKQKAVTLDDLVAVFDADMAGKKEFLEHTVPLFDTGKDVGMVLTPQYFTDSHESADIFNHTNFDFWEYMQPGYDGIGFISCTGTNFVARAAAFKSAGWFPLWTVTEDYALGMMMKAKGWVCRYVNESLAFGTSPEDTRSSFQQRSRWCKGHFQIFFSNHCPLFMSGLSFTMRILYCVPAWNYVINGITTIVFTNIPIAFIWLGVFPLKSSIQFAGAITWYIISIQLLVYRVHSPYHIMAVWFGGIANTILWYAYFKAFIRTALFGKFGGFKATAKGQVFSLINCGCFKALRHDLYMPGFITGLSIVTVVFAIVQAARSPDGVVIDSPLAIAIVWCIINIIPYLLLFTWAFAHRWGWGLIRVVCATMFAGSVILMVLTMSLTWAVSSTDKQFSYCGLFPLRIGSLRLNRPGFLRRCVPIGSAAPTPAPAAPAAPAI